jgi:ribulose-phosphate 3-epimerase
MKSPHIAPSMLAAPAASLGDALQAVTHAGADVIHWDIMDGHFVPNLTFGPHIVKACRGLSKLEFDVHLMVTNPENWIEAFVDAGADCLDIHVELCERVVPLLQEIKSKECRAGLVINPQTNIETITDTMLAMIDRVIVMSVQPGFGGQSFIDVTDKIKTLAQRCQPYPHIDIMVDGGINLETAPKVLAAGAKTLVVGYGLFSAAPDFEGRMNKLRGCGQC